MEEAVLKLRSSLKEKLVKQGIKPEGKGITRHLSRLLMQSGPGGGGGGGGWGERVRGDTGRIRSKVQPVRIFVR